MGTVDSFQGQERDITAITFTRSNPQGEIGFLSNIRRMNVGMTRAWRMRWSNRFESVMAVAVEGARFSFACYASPVPSDTRLARQ